MEPPVGALDAAIVRVRDERGEVVGAGFLVGPREIVTCAHVVARALGRPDGDGAVRVDFPLVAPGEQYTAEVVAWHPSKLTRPVTLPGCAFARPRLRARGRHGW